MKTFKRILFLLIALAVFLVGRWSVGDATMQGVGADPHASHASAADDSAEPAAPTIWTCPMHAQIKLPDPVPCPICGMDLVPLSADEGDPRQLVMSPASKELAQIVSAIVRRSRVMRSVRMVGMIDYDESALKTISAYVPGRLDRLYVDYTGVSVQQGDHLVWLYSPELLSAQEELLSSRERMTTTAGEASSFLESSNRDAYAAAREKLLLWGLELDQVEEIEARGTAEDHMMLTSPSSGVVIDKFLDEGTYVKTGTPVYRIADLTRLWVRLDAYEQDLAWLRYGQDITFEVEALPGETFEGRISYVDPFIHEHTRTAKVRINVENADGRLKPGMFVRAVAAVQLAEGGTVVSPDLEGKWVSPMHPEIVKDGPGVCDVCGMDLVQASALGHGSPLSSGSLPLVVPRSAVLVTGQRAIVFIDVPGAERPTYEGREVVLGPRAGDDYVVFSGLEEGERVVVQGAFRIDSSMQILAKPSMMSMGGDSSRPEGPAAREFRAALDPIYHAYLTMQVALADDDEEAARVAVSALEGTLDAPVAAGLPAEHRTAWKETRATLEAALGRAAGTSDIEALRAQFETISSAALSLAIEFGTGDAHVLHEAYCPMAFDDKGAAWLQAGETISNPYFGASMLRCGTIRETFEP